MIFWNTQSIFIRVPKTASTSILYSLLDCSEKCSKNEFNKFFDSLKPSFLHKNYSGDPHHVSYHVLRNNIPTNERDLIDTYFKFTFVRNPFDRAISVWKYIQKMDSNNITFKEFVCKYLTAECTDNGIWFSDQHSQIQGCDFIGKFENLQADFDVVCDRLNIKRNPLPVKNTTKHKHYTEYYDDETLEIVSIKYKNDIESFDYKFGE